MPELPDITVYIEALDARLVGRKFHGLKLASPFLLRTAKPPIGAIEGQRVRAASRIGKRIAIGFDNDHWMVLHLMIAGRLHWHISAPKLTPKGHFAIWEFENGFLSLTEAGTAKRASLEILGSTSDLRAVDPGGLDVLECGQAAFVNALKKHNHTLKRFLTNPRILSGIGNAYSDEILHRARLSPVTLTQKLSNAEAVRLFDASRETLRTWIRILRDQAGAAFPEKVTAFRPEMAVHGKYGKPCPDCGTAVQRIRHATNETNYCPRCQTRGKLLADRSLSQLLKKDWPSTIDEWEATQR